LNNFKVTRLDNKVTISATTRNSVDNKESNDITQEISKIIAQRQRIGLINETVRNGSHWR
jgi:hypothetical protein